jgi:hypothetical protein
VLVLSSLGVANKQKRAVIQGRERGAERKRAGRKREGSESEQG